ncbi:MAG: B12-binding domain-containing radical SAM protein [Desulfocapsa sp.]|nr:MAG: B12-binding domain-containing radical SAM protein [Desulfocapsa sp.]
MKILLISPNTHRIPYPVYPIGLDYVAGALGETHQVKIADLNIVERDALARQVIDFSPDIIGLSLRNVDNTEIGNPLFFIEKQKELVCWLRSTSKAVIVCGGAGFTILAREIFDKIQPDYGIVGEGERFGQLVDALENDLPVSDIPGLITADHSKSPLPWAGEQTRSLAANEHTQFYVDHGGMLNLQSKRGCSFRCIYCPYPYIEGNKHRRVDAEIVAKTALNLQNRGAGYFFITDSAFNSDIVHSLQVAEAFREHGVTIPWGGFFAPVKLPDSYFTTLKDCGLSHVEFGTESLSDTMLKNYQKPFRVKDVFTAHQQAMAAGIHVAHYFLLGGPGESEQTLCETLDKVEKLQKAVYFFFTGMRIYPHTKLFDIAMEEGKINKETNLLEPYYYTSDAITPDAIERRVAARAAERINWVVESGGKTSAETVSRMHSRGFTGPLWEYLVR